MTVGAVFGTGETVVLVPPTRACPGGPRDWELEQFRQLLTRERHEFEVELGVPVVIGQASHSTRPLFLVGPRDANPLLAELSPRRVERPTVRLDRSLGVLVADAPDLPGAVESLSLLRTLTATDSHHVEARDCEDTDGAVDRIRWEMAATYPAFELRDIDWQEICSRHERHTSQADEPLPAFQRWLAELGDMHTGVHPHPSHGVLPYTVHLTPSVARFVEVPRWSEA